MLRRFGTCDLLEAAVMIMVLTIVIRVVIITTIIITINTE